MNKIFDPYIKPSKMKRVEEKQEGFKKKPKRATNIPGKGMRIINSMSTDDDSYDDFEDDYNYRTIDL